MPDPTPRPTKVRLVKVIADQQKRVIAEVDWGIDTDIIDEDGHVYHLTFDADA